MLSQKVKDILKNFNSEYSDVLSCHEMYNLSFEWPYIGFINSLLDFLKHRESLDPEEKKLVRYGAAVLAAIANNIVEKAGIKCIIDLDDKLGIFMANLYKDEPVLYNSQINIEKDLLYLLKETPKELPILDGLSRNMYSDSCYISSYAVGVISTMSTFGTGTLIHLEKEKANDLINKILKQVAFSCCAYYEKLFKSIDIGAMPLFYLNNLVFPPLFTDNSFPGLEAIKKICDFCQEYKIPEKHLLKAAINISKFPEELLSLSGLTIVGGLATSLEDIASIAPLALEKNNNMILSRTAMLELRSHFNLTPDWILETKDLAFRASRSELEVEMNCFPWLKLTKSRLVQEADNKKITEMLLSLCNLDLTTAARITKQMAEYEPRDFEMRIQNIWLELALGNYDLALYLAKSLLTEPEVESNFSFLYTLATAYLVNSDTISSEKTFSQAYRRAMLDTDIILSGNDYAFVLARNDQYSEALKVLETILHKNTKKYSLNLLINYCDILENFGRKEESKQIFTKDLSRLFPSSPKVIAGILHYHFNS